MSFLGSPVVHQSLSLHSILALLHLLRLGFCPVARQPFFQVRDGALKNFDFNVESFLLWTLWILGRLYWPAHHLLLDQHDEDIGGVDDSDQKGDEAEVPKCAMGALGVLDGEPAQQASKALPQPVVGAALEAGHSGEHSWAKKLFFIAYNV